MITDLFNRFRSLRRVVELKDAPQHVKDSYDLDASPPDSVYLYPGGLWIAIDRKELLYQLEIDQEQLQSQTLDDLEERLFYWAASNVGIAQIREDCDGEQA